MYYINTCIIFYIQIFIEIRIFELDKFLCETPNTLHIPNSLLDLVNYKNYIHKKLIIHFISICPIMITYALVYKHLIYIYILYIYFLYCANKI